MPPKAKPATPAAETSDETTIDPAALLDAPEQPADDAEPEAPIVDLAPPIAEPVTAVEPEPEPEPTEQVALVAAPLDPPAEDVPAFVPVATPVAGSVARPTPKPYSKFVVEGGEPVTAAIFRDENPMFTYVVTDGRIYEEWLPEGFHTPQSRLVYPRGAHVPRNEAAAFLAHVGLL